jgi:molecular chaperone HscB
MADLNHFERLGLPVRFDQDNAEVERLYLAHSRQLHPDFHTLASSAEQRSSETLTAALNEAYATVRDPFRRAEYLLTLLGGPSAAQSRDMDPAFLEEMLDLRMEIEELREEGRPDSPARSTLERQLQARDDELLRQTAAAFAAIETASDDRGLHLGRVRQTLNAARYVHGLLRDLAEDS